MLRRARLVRTIAVIGSMAAFLALGVGSANAAGESPKPIVGTGSDVAWRVMQSLDGIYNTSPGCNLLTASNQPLDQTCQAALPNQDIVTTENYRHDFASELAPIGGSAGVNELCQEGLAGVYSGINYARQTSAPSTSTCTGTNFVAYARDALDFQVFPNVAGAGVVTANFNNGHGNCGGKGICLTQQDLKDIFVNCTITNWSDVGGANVPIHPYVPLPQYGTRSAWDKFLGTGGIPADTSSCVTNANHITPGETEDSYVHAIGDEANAIVAVSYGSWQARFKKGATGHVASHGALGKVDGIPANAKNLLSGFFPYSRYIYNVYCGPNSTSPGATACGGGNATAATTDYVGEEGWICKVDHDNVPYTSPAVTYRTAIANAIKAAGFVPVTQGVIGSGNTNSDYCRLFTH